MTIRNKTITALAFAATAIATTGTSMAADRPLKVVELFTSQGCSSCPPANANLIGISHRPDVLALTFSVTYWDYLGWKDTFGRQEYTDRQVTYEPQLNQRGPFTPQMVVNGASTIVGNDNREVLALLSQTTPLKGPDIVFGSRFVEIKSASAGNRADVWMVRYDPFVESVPVERGENGGRLLQHSHVVHQLEKLGSWSGDRATYRLPKGTAGLKTAILVQLPSGGPILAAATD